MRLTDGTARTQSAQDAQATKLIAWLDGCFHREEEWYKKFLECRGPSAQKLLDLLQDLLDLSPTKQPRLLNALRRLSSESKLYPHCFRLPHLQNKIKTGGGTFSDVYVASLGDQQLAVKEMRVFGEMDIATYEEAFSKEAITWRQLSHPNVLPFYGLFKDGTQLCLVSPWMENGHICKFLKTQPQACNIDKRLSLILDIALGLEYLHKQGIVHADLKGDNILVTPALNACIADFGLSKVAPTPSSLPHFISQPYGTGAVHYQAPELHAFDAGTKLKAADSRSDIYSFGCLMYEVMAGKHPFSNMLNIGAVISEVTNGRRPPCPPPECRLEIRKLNAAWTLVEACWAQNPNERPTAAQVVEALKGTGIGARETKPPGSWDHSSTSRFRRDLGGMQPLPSVPELQMMVYGTHY
ncbi:kinase-like domain-containing protein [Roridomyces roridus]|uniref:Kinase-like domain-containing protein n=1 Tax=Roridomyces roridus TaxID=1738132 RepID=A0AAD7CKP6_9AGAR|nr:kinase-like domain-containing protein [Roridomyces roridus]